MLPDVITLRTAEPADTPAIAELTREAYTPWIPIVGREPRPMGVDYAEAVKSSRFDLAYIDGELAALIETTPQEDWLLVVNLAVRPAFQHRGLGQRLLGLADELARDGGFIGARLFTNQRMERNIAVYRRYGYVIEREEVWGDAVAVHMIKRL